MNRGQSTKQRLIAQAFRLPDIADTNMFFNIIIESYILCILAGYHQTLSLSKTSSLVHFHREPFAIFVSQFYPLQFFKSISIEVISTNFSPP